MATLGVTDRFAGSVDANSLSALFRQEALQSRRARLEGDVVLRDAGPLHYAGYLLPVAVLPWLVATLFWSHARVQTAPGWLSTSEGLVIVRAGRAGRAALRIERRRPGECRSWLCSLERGPEPEILGCPPTAGCKLRATGGSA